MNMYFALELKHDTVEVEALAVFTRCIFQFMMLPESVVYTDKYMPSATTTAVPLLDSLY
jgi:hypothetical protein